MAKKIDLTQKGSVRKEEKTAARKDEKKSGPTAPAFGRDNYIILLIGIGVLLVGYLLMIGGGSDNPKNFSPAIFDTQRITIAPITLLVGFAIVLYGIMKKPRSVNAE